MRDCCGIAQWASCELVPQVDIPTQLPTAIRLHTVHAHTWLQVMYLAGNTFTSLVSSPDLIWHVYRFQYNTRDTESHWHWSWFLDHDFKGYGLGLKQVQPPRIDTWLW